MIKLGMRQAEREEPVPALVQQDRMPQALRRPIHFIQKVLNDITKGTSKNLICKRARDQGNTHDS